MTANRAGSSQPAEAEGIPHRLCPRCQSVRVHRSHCRGLGEQMVKLGGGRVFRCHECSFRFVKLGSSILLMSDLSRLVRRVYLALLILVALAVVVTAVAWFSQQGATVNRDSARQDRSVRTYAAVDFRQLIQYRLDLELPGADSAIGLEPLEQLLVS